MTVTNEVRQFRDNEETASACSSCPWFNFARRIVWVRFHSAVPALPMSRAREILVDCCRFCRNKGRRRCCRLTAEFALRCRSLLCWIV